MTEANQDQLIDTNQTEFSAVEPLFEQRPAEPKTTEKKPLPQTQKFLMIGIGAAVILILVVILLAVMMGRRPARPDEIAEPTPTPATQLDPLRQEVNNLRTELETADPTKQELPFPPVNLDIFLEQQQPQ